MNDSPSAPVLRNPEDNPWYLLATLHGVAGSADSEAHQQNRIYWNRYQFTFLAVGDIEELHGRAPEIELTPLSNAEKNYIHDKLIHRSGGKNIEFPYIRSIIDFSFLEFESIFCLDGYIFNIPVNSEHSVFLERIDFNKSIFLSGANFSKSRFRSDAVFSNILSLGLINFANSKFCANTFFNKSEFRSNANFRRVNFDKYLNMTESKFRSEAFFSESVFLEQVDFSGSLFDNLSEFINIETKYSATLEKCVFTNQPPQFAGAKLHQGTVWRGVKWPETPKSPDQAARFIKAYEPLKLEMDRLKKHEDELFFFAKEMECRRVEAGRLKGLPIAIYGHLCKYGQSYIDPLFWLLALTAFGSLVLTPVLHWDFPLALGVSAANTLGSLGLRKELIDPDILHGLPGWLQVFSGLQTLLGLILLFLTGLGLRNRFRMK